MGEVLGQQPEDVQDFMEVSAILRVLDPQVCKSLCGEKDSTEMLSYLRHEELFVVNLGEAGLRYHHVFRQFLLEQTGEDMRRDL